MAAKKAQSNTKAVHGVITKPRITEKATKALEANTYTFDISPRTTKVEVARAIKSLYNVTPVKINIVNMKSKNVFVRGRHGTKGGGKKAMVYLKKGDTIEFV